MLRRQLWKTNIIAFIESNELVLIHERRFGTRHQNLRIITMHLDTHCSLEWDCSGRKSWPWEAILLDFDQIQINPKEWVA